METNALLQAIEALPENGRNALEGYLEVLIHKYIPEEKEKYFPLGDNGELSPGIESLIEEQIERHLTSSGSTLSIEEILVEIEKDLNIKIPDRISQSLLEINKQFGKTLKRLV